MAYRVTGVIGFIGFRGYMAYCFRVVTRGFADATLSCCCGIPAASTWL